MSNDSLLYYTEQMPSEAIANFTFKNNTDLTFTDVSESWGLDEKNFLMVPHMQTLTMMVI